MNAFNSDKYSFTYQQRIQRAALQTYISDTEVDDTDHELLINIIQTELSVWHREVEREIEPMHIRVEALKKDKLRVCRTTKAHQGKCENDRQLSVSNLFNAKKKPLW